MAGARIDEAIAAWETAHPDRLQSTRDDGQFFGFKEVGASRLERFTQFLLVPAVRDAGLDATEGRGSVITELMDLVIRNTLAQREDIQRLREETQTRYEEIVDPSKLDELSTLAQRMSATLAAYAPGSELKLDWLPGDSVEIPMPRADVKVVEDGFPSNVERAGHGLQRAFNLTALQHLAFAQFPSVLEEGTEDVETSDTPTASSEPEQQVADLPAIILAIEEPELYQHPSRQRHLAELLWGLAHSGTEGAASTVQVMYTTHSPLLVDLRRFHLVRLLRKESGEEGKPKCTRMWGATLDQVNRRLEEADGVAPGSYAAEGLEARLQTLMTPWTNEGFFAAVVVLVEGEDDRAAVMGIAGVLGHELDGMDISVIPCQGKTNLHKAAGVFDAFGLPVYTMWDSDQGDLEKRVEDNHRLLRFFGAQVEDYPAVVGVQYACFAVDLETTMRSELGEGLYDGLLANAQDQLGYDTRAQARKNPLVIQRILDEAMQQGSSCRTLNAVVEHIVRLRTQAAD